MPTGPMVGLLPGAAFAEGRATMHPGDALVIFTDGLVEAEDAAGEELGDAALVEDDAALRQTSTRFPWREPAGE